MKIEHILLPSDLSQEALRPAEAVADMASSAGARVTLLHVVHDLQITPHGAPFAPMVSTPSLEGEMERARAELADFRSSFPENLKVEVAVVSAFDIPRGIVGFAESHDVDLIAISTHGRTGLRHLALGSVAEQVIRRSHVPVLSFQRS